ncbi:hypothetical protein WMW71_12855 [Flavobacterium buctense]|uniref:Serine protease n=1 Tax=Flavobacterium buctense TaxID=1648146 RepID=A0ABU9E5I8_9FLAO|nr:hypothetical protein [Flavobacterium buctense]
MTKISNDLSDYSYYLAYIDINGNIFGNATGFLFKKNNTIFLITNVHVLFGKNVNDLSPQPHLVKYGNFKICLRYKKNDGSMELFDIEIDKHRQEYSKLLFPKMLDVFSFSLPSLPKDGQFYYINNDFDLDDGTHSDNLIAYGYPAIDHFKEGDYRYRKCRQSFGIIDGEAKENNRRINTTLYIENGMSGSPVFSASQVSNSEVIKFYGIGDGFAPETKKSIITHLFASSPFKSFFDK